MGIRCPPGGGGDMQPLTLKETLIAHSNDGPPRSRSRPNSVRAAALTGHNTTRKTSASKVPLKASETADSLHYRASLARSTSAARNPR